MLVQRVLNVLPRCGVEVRVAKPSLKEDGQLLQMDDVRVHRLRRGLEWKMEGNGTSVLLSLIRR